MRTLVLFDVDGTLVHGGPAKDAFHAAMIEAYGTTGDIEVHEFAGKTDPSIARELLTGAGLEADEVDAGFPDLWKCYLRELEARLTARPMKLLAGVAELLRALDGVGEVAMGLVTGNIAGGAHLKLASAGIREHFQVGGYGSDHEVRDHLPAVAIERAARHFGVPFSKDRVHVVGDTPRDVACGRHEGVRTLAVATGRFPLETLRDAGADAVFDDFKGTQEVVDELLRG